MDTHNEHSVLQRGGTHTHATGLMHSRHDGTGHTCMVTGWHVTTQVRSPHTNAPHTLNETLVHWIIYTAEECLCGEMSSLIIDLLSATFHCSSEATVTIIPAPSNESIIKPD